MYTKEINGRQVFSSCTTIQTSEGFWISNPTEEQILAEGWEIYIPEEPVYQPREEPDMTEIMMAVKQMLSSDITSLSDEEALSIAALYPTWRDKMDQPVNVGERYWYDGKLYKVIQAHTVQENWTPDVSSSLFTEISIEEWPDWRQPIGSEDAYKTGDKVSHDSKHWISIADNNVWEPGVYGWDEVN